VVDLAACLLTCVCLLAGCRVLFILHHSHELQAFHYVAKKFGRHEATALKNGAVILIWTPFSPPV
jgi:hypothetical protein